MNKKTIRKALNRAEYMNSIGKLGAFGTYFNGESYCIIGCLFSNDLIEYFKNKQEDSFKIKDLYRRYPKLESLLGMNAEEAQELQDTNDTCSPLIALYLLWEFAK
jgi:hypothetical protein